VARTPRSGVVPAGSTGGLGPVTVTGTPAAGDGIVATGATTAVWEPILVPPNAPVTVTTTYAIQTADSLVLGNAAGGSFSITLPTSPQTGGAYPVVKSDTSAHTVTVTGTGLSVVLTGQGDGRIFCFDGTDWQVLAIARSNATGPVFDVTAFGAVADSNGTTGNGTDNTTAFNTAIAVALVAGGTIWVPPGYGKSYRLATAGLTPINASKVKLKGAGMGLSVLFFDTLDNSGTTHRIWFAGAGVGGTPGSISNVEASDFTVFNRSNYQASPAAAHNLAFVNCLGVVCQRVESYQSTDFGIATVGCDNVLIDGCHVHDTGSDGIHVSGNAGTNHRTATGVRVVNNLVHDTGDDCLSVGYYGDAINDVVVANNIVYNSGSRGIPIMGPCNNVIAANNVITDTWLMAMSVDAVAGNVTEVTIVGNRIVNPGSYTGSAIARGVGVGGGIFVDPDDGHSHSINHLNINSNAVAGNVRNGYIWLGSGFVGGTNGGATALIGVVITGNWLQGTLTQGGLGATGGQGGGSSNNSPTGHYPGVYVRNSQHVMYSGNHVASSYQEGLLADAANTATVAVFGNNWAALNTSAAGSINGVTISSGFGAVANNVFRLGTLAATVAITNNTTPALNSGNVTD